MKEYTVEIYTRDDKVLYYGRCSYPIIEENGSLRVRDNVKNEEITIPSTNLSYFIVHINQPVTA